VPTLPHARKPILCYVTDRLALADPAALGAIIRHAAEAGVDWIQIREKELDARPLTELARSALAETRETGASIVVNDRLDVALAAGAVGVHLGETSLPLEIVAEWRRAANRKQFLIGVSCHSLDAARAAERGGADYVFFGPVFATPSKAGFGPPQGIERLREVCGAVKIPVLAIGGIEPENAGRCLEAGAAGVAAIRLFQESADVGAAVLRARGGLQRGTTSKP
jgi:thiamine-phosphate pyrophosphorylase